ncbi:hypothetical protein [Gilvimarinus chinensis]|uniref:hypothetical protein n=1 Tax=Gilvimarinus chinensis TaxID=396005 RepID=UPI000365A7B4|nr:hypothetical protein [Gilvimarinus chinensis]
MAFKEQGKQEQIGLEKFVEKASHYFRPVGLVSPGEFFALLISQARFYSDPYHVPIHLFTDGRALPVNIESTRKSA